MENTTDSEGREAEGWGGGVGGQESIYLQALGGVCVGL